MRMGRKPPPPSRGSIAGKGSVNASCNGGIAEIVGYRMRVVICVLDIRHILDPVYKRVAIQACVERHAVSFVGRI